MFSFVLYSSFRPRIGIVNRGDSFRRRRSRSSSIIPPSSPLNAALQELPNRPEPCDSYLVAMLGTPGVGKQTLLSQFRTSECINAYETGRGECDESRKTALERAQSSKVFFLASQLLLKYINFTFTSIVCHERAFVVAVEYGTFPFYIHITFCHVTSCANTGSNFITLL